MKITIITRTRSSMVIYRYIFIRVYIQRVPIYNQTRVRSQKVVFGQCLLYITISIYSCGRRRAARASLMTRDTLVF